MIGVGIGIGVERDSMAFGHEKLDVYRAAIEYVPTDEKAKVLLDKIVAMLTKLGQRGYAVHEEPGAYRTDRTPIPIPTPTPMAAGETAANQRVQTTRNGSRLTRNVRRWRAGFGTASGVFC